MINKLDKYEDDSLQEGILDLKLFFPISDLLLEPLHNINMKPNHITLLSAVSSLFGIFLYCKNKISFAIFFYLLGYLFDCIDGRMARKYNQGSTLGMILDTVTDNLTALPLFILFFYKTFISVKEHGIIHCRFFYLILLIVITYFFSAVFGINEALDSYLKYKDDNFPKFKKKEIEKENWHNTPLGKLFLFIYKQSYNSYRNIYKEPINEKNHDKVKKHLYRLKEFGPGNYNIFIVILMIIF